MAGTPHVTAVLVVHDGRPWLPAALAGLAAQSRTPDVTVAVDTGSRDGSAALLPPSWGAPVTVDRATGFGAAVRAGIARADELTGHSAAASGHDYVWLLHDDAVPAPQALEELLATAERTGAALVGCKERDSTDPRLLLAVGLTVDRAGRRSGPARPGELDQGQHDGAGAAVLAASTAGLLVRRDAWDALGGLDPALPLFQDDIDLGWRAARAGMRTVIAPGALIRHDRAAARGHRVVDVAPGRAARRLDRAAAGYVQVVNAPAGLALLVLGRVLVTGLGRALLAVLARHPHRAADEASAAVGLLLHPGTLRAGRAWRRGQVAPRDQGVRWLLAPPGRELARRIGGVVERSAGRRVRAVGGAEEDSDDAPPQPTTSSWAWVAAHPGAALTLVVAVIALLAERSLLGSGVLAGERLLPAPGSATTLWHSWSAGWHPSSAGGSATAAPPWTPWLALLSTVTLGRPSLAVDLLVLGAVPLAAWSSWRAGRELTPSRGLRLWGAAVWATLPLTGAAVAQGRFDVCVAIVAAPPLLAAGIRLVRADAGRCRRAFGTGIALAVAASFAPPLWTAAACLVLATSAVLVVARADQVGARVRALVVVLIPAPLLALPWLPHLVDEPRVLIAGLGLDGGLAAGAAPHAWGVLVLRPGGPGAVSADWTVPLFAVVVGVAVLLTARSAARGRQVLVAWGVAVVGFALAVGAERLPVDGGRAWTGPFLVLAAAGVVGAVLAGAAGSAGALTGSSFGWRQLGAAVLAGCCLLEPVVAGVAWVARGAGGPLSRSSSTLLPPDLLSDLAATRDPVARVLVLSRSADGAVRWDLRAVSGPVLGDEDLATTPAAEALVSALVGDLAVPRGTDAALALAAFDVRAVAVPGSAATSLTKALDGQTGLVRRLTPLPVSLWQLAPGLPVGGSEVLAAPVAATALHPAAVTAGSGRAPTPAQLAATPPVPLGLGVGGSAPVAAGPAGRLLVLSQAADSGWHASLNGAALQPVRAWGWAQAFRLPADGGRVTLTFDAGPRPWLVGLDVAVLVALLALALPATGADDRRADTSGTPR